MVLPTIPMLGLCKDGFILCVGVASESTDELPVYRLSQVRRRELGAVLMHRGGIRLLSRD